MDITYDIFKEDPAGPIWVESVTGLTNMTERLKYLAETDPGQYFSYDASKTQIAARIGVDLSRAYDLFRQDEGGERLWVETVIGLNNVKKRLIKLSSLKPGKYLVYDPTEKQFVEPFKKTA